MDRKEQRLEKDTAAPEKWETAIMRRRSSCAEMLLFQKELVWYARSREIASL
jgi:hypothetical protein